MKAIIILLMLAIVSCTENPQIDTKAEGEKLMQISRDWSKSASTNNIDTILSYWADDAIVMEPGRPALKGKEEIRTMLEGTSKIPGFSISWEPESVVVSKSGDLAYMIESTRITVHDSLGNPVIQNNKATTIWRKDPDGRWRNVVDMWN